MLTSAIEDFGLVNDTGTLDTDRVTSDPRVLGTVTGNASNSWTEVRFDHYADGTVDGYLYLYSVGEQFTYDPRSVDYSLSYYAGSFALNYQVADYDASYNASPGEWQLFTYTLEQPSEIDVWDDSTYMGVYDGMSTVDFGNATVGSPLCRSFTIYNSGYGVLTLDAASLTVPTGFRLLGGLVSEIAPYASASLTIELEAAVAGSYSGNVSFATNDSDEDPFDFAVTGQVSTPEPEIEVQDDDTYTTLYDGMSTVDFGSTSTGSPLSRSFTVSNYGQGTLTVDPAALPLGFSLVGTFPSSVAAYSSASFTIQLDATGPGGYHGSVSFGTNDSDEDPFDFTISGQVSTPEPEIEVQDDYAYTTLYDGMSTVDFGSTSTGSPLSRSFTISNYGQGTLTVAPALLSMPPGFRLVGSFPSAIGAYLSASFTVELDAGVAGSFGGNVSFATNDSDENPFEFTVTGQVVGDTSANAAPTLDAIPDPPAIDEDAGQQVLPLTGITAGSGESQNLTVTATSGSPQLVTGLSVTYASPDATGILVFAPVANQSGTGLITVTVRDDGGTANGGVDLIQRTFQITVHPVNDAPFLADPIAPIEVVVNSVLTVVGLDGYFGDADTATSGDLLEYAVTVNPPVPDDPDYDPDLLVGRIVDRALNLQYAPGRTGHVDVTVRATDQAGTWAETTVRVTVTLPGNSAPVVADPIADISVEAGQPYLVFDLSEVFGDADVVAGTDSLAYSVTNTAPALLTETLSSSLLTLSLIPSELGTAELTVRVTDNQGAYAETSFAVTVVPFNNPPAATPIPPVVVDEDAADVVLKLRDFFSDAEDPDEDLVLEVALAASSEFNPVVFDLNPNTGELTLSFVRNGYGSAEYTVTARDTGRKAVATGFSVTVNPVNDLPTAPASTVELSLLDFPEQTFIDLRDYFDDLEDGPDLSYEIVADSITNPDAFDGTPFIDPDDHLWLSAAAILGQGSDMTIRATDADAAVSHATLRFMLFMPMASDPGPSGSMLPKVFIYNKKHTGENAADAGYFWVHMWRTTDLDSSVRVPYTLSGSAVYGVDYTSVWPSSGEMILPAVPYPGVQLTILKLTPVDNTDPGEHKTITLTLGASDDLELGENSSDTITLHDDDRGAIVYVALSRDTRENIQNATQKGSFLLESVGELGIKHNATASGYTGPVPPPGGYLTWDANSNVVPVSGMETGSYRVKFSLAGSATYGADFSGPEQAADLDANGNWSVEMGPGASVTIPIVPEEDYNPEFDETVELTLQPSDPSDKPWVTAVDASGRWIGSYGEGSYGLGSPSADSLTIEEDSMGWVGLFVRSPTSPVEWQLAAGVPLANILTGHTYIAGWNPYDGFFAFGFYPTPPHYYGTEKGQILPDGGAAYTHFRIWPISGVASGQLRAAITTDRAALSDADPSNDLIYSLGDGSYGNNTYTCTTWALELLAAAGIGVGLQAQPYWLARSEGFQEVGP